MIAEKERRMARAIELLAKTQASLLLTLVRLQLLSREQAHALLSEAVTPLHEDVMFPDRMFQNLLRTLRDPDPD